MILNRRSFTDFSKSENTEFFFIMSHTIHVRYIYLYTCRQICHTWMLWVLICCWFPSLSSVQIVRTQKVRNWTFVSCPRLGSREPKSFATQQVNDPVVELQIFWGNISPPIFFGEMIQFNGRLHIFFSRPGLVKPPREHP